MKNKLESFLAKVENKEPVNYLKALNTSASYQREEGEDSLKNRFRNSVRQLNKTKKSSGGGEGNLLDLALELISRNERKCIVCLESCNSEKHQDLFKLASNPVIHYYSHSYDEEINVKGKSGAGSIYFEDPTTLDPVLSKYDPIAFSKFSLTHESLAKIITLLASEGVSNISIRGGIPERFGVPLIKTLTQLSNSENATIDKPLLAPKGDLLVTYQRSPPPKFGEYLNIPLTIHSRGTASPFLYEILSTAVDLWDIDISLYNNKCTGSSFGISNFEDLLLKNLETILSSPSALILHIIIDPYHYECCTKKFLDNIERSGLNLEIRFDLRKIPKDSPIRKEISILVESKSKFSFSESFVENWVSRYYW